MKSLIKNFRQFINESDRYLDSNNAAIFEDPMSYDEDGWAGHDNLADWLTASQDGGPDWGLDVEAAVDAICADCGLSPREVRIHGVLTHDAAINIDQSSASPHLKTPGGYPGAPSVDKYTAGGTVYYVASMYDGALVASCNR